jgi:hypothetical protein
LHASYHQEQALSITPLHAAIRAWEHRSFAKGGQTYTVEVAEVRAPAAAAMREASILNPGAAGVRL